MAAQMNPTCSRATAATGNRGAFAVVHEMPVATVETLFRAPTLGHDGGRLITRTDSRDYDPNQGDHDGPLLAVIMVG